MKQARYYSVLAIKKYRESYMNETSKDSESQPVNEAQNVNVPISKEPFQIRKEIEVDNDTLNDTSKDNSARNKSCESKSPAAEETVESEDRSDARPNLKFKSLLALNWLNRLNGSTYWKSKSFCHWVTNGIPINSHVPMYQCCVSDPFFSPQFH